MNKKKDIFACAQGGELLRKNDPEHGKFPEEVAG